LCVCGLCEEISNFRGNFQQALSIGQMGVTRKEKQEKDVTSESPSLGTSGAATAILI
jgi:hypothetical protein